MQVDHELRRLDDGVCRGVELVRLKLPRNDALTSSSIQKRRLAIGQNSSLHIRPAIVENIRSAVLQLEVGGERKQAALERRLSVRMFISRSPEAEDGKTVRNALATI